MEKVIELFTSNDMEKIDELLIAKPWLDSE